MASVFSRFKAFATLHEDGEFYMTRDSYSSFCAPLSVGDSSTELLSRHLPAASFGLTFASFLSLTHELAALKYPDLESSLAYSTFMSRHFFAEEGRGGGDATGSSPLPLSPRTPYAVGGAAATPTPRPSLGGHLASPYLASPAPEQVPPQRSDYASTLSILHTLTTAQPEAVFSPLPYLASPSSPASSQLPRCFAEARHRLLTRRDTCLSLVEGAAAAVELDRSLPPDYARNAVSALDPGALEVAQGLGQALAASTSTEGALPLLHGVLLLVQDTIDIASPFLCAKGAAAAFTALAGAGTPSPARDAPCLTPLRALGAVLLGRCVSIPPTASASGVRNAINPACVPGGAGAGAAVAVARGMALGAVGMGGVGGCLLLPAAANGVAGFQPTFGLLPRTHTLPLLHARDAPGAVARCAEDLALLVHGMAEGEEMGEGGDPAVVGRLTAPVRQQLRALAQQQQQQQQPGAAVLQGLRLGVLSCSSCARALKTPALQQALQRLAAAGAVLVSLDLDTHSGWEEVRAAQGGLGLGLQAAVEGAGAAQELQAQVRAYLEGSSVEVRREGGGSSSSSSSREQASVAGSAALTPLAAGPGGLDRLMREAGVRALLAPTAAAAAGKAGRVEPYAGLATVAAVAGYPHITLPLGGGGMPLGLSVLGTAWSDALLLEVGMAFERLP